MSKRKIDDQELKMRDTVTDQPDTDEPEVKNVCHDATTIASSDTGQYGDAVPKIDIDGPNSKKACNDNTDEPEVKNVCHDATPTASSDTGQCGDSTPKRSSTRIKHKLEKEKADEEEALRESNSNNVKWGDRIPDDLINIFCSRLSDAMAGKVEGLIAMQSIIVEPDHCVDEISGRRQVLQVIVDAARPHYVLVEWRPEWKQVHVYDPYMTGSTLRCVEISLTDEIRSQIVTLFGHLFAPSYTGDGFDCGNIPIVMEHRMQQQRDEWSCGLRAIGHLLLRVFNRNLAEFDVDLEKVLEFVLSILATPSPSIDQFKDVDLGKPKKVPRKREPTNILLNTNTFEVTLRDEYQ